MCYQSSVNGYGSGQLRNENVSVSNRVGAARVRFSDEEVDDNVFDIIPRNEDQRRSDRGSNDFGKLTVFNCSTIQPPEKFTRSHDVGTWINQFELYIKANQVSNKRDVLLSCINHECLRILGELRTSDGSIMSYDQVKEAMFRFFWFEK